MKKQTRFPFLLPVLLILLLLISLSVSAEETSGDCGDNAHWTLSDSGVLTISGTGLVSTNSWSSQSKSILHVVIEDGITGIPARAFENYSNLSTCTLSQSMAEIPAYAFSRCKSLKEIVLPNSVTKIGNSAFSDTGLEKVTLSSALTEIERFGFAACAGLKEIRFPASLEILGDSAFVRCTNLHTVYFAGSPPKVSTYTFWEVTANAYYAWNEHQWEIRGVYYHGGLFTYEPYYEPEMGEKHVWGEWIITVPPTLDFFVGEKERTCLTCGFTQLVYIPIPEEDSPIEPPESQPETPTPPINQPTTSVPPTTPPVTTTLPTTTPPVTEPATQPVTGSSTPPTTEPASTPDTVPNTSQATQPNTSQPATSAPTSSDSIPSPTADNAEKSDPTVLIVCIVLSVVLISSVAVWYFLRKKK